MQKQTRQDKARSCETSRTQTVCLVRVSVCTSVGAWTKPSFMRLERTETVRWRRHLCGVCTVALDSHACSLHDDNVGRQCPSGLRTFCVSCCNTAFGREPITGGKAGGRTMWNKVIPTGPHTFTNSSRCLFLSTYHSESSAIQNYINYSFINCNREQKLNLNKLFFFVGMRHFTYLLVQFQLGETLYSLQSWMGEWHSQAWNQMHVQMLNVQFLYIFFYEGKTVCR